MVWERDSGKYTNMFMDNIASPPPPASREELLTGLKKNWEVLHHQYQGLSVVTDTAPKKARKERMEAEMKQLERDIELIERHKVILVSQPEVVH